MTTDIKKRRRWYKLIIVAITLLLVYAALKIYVGPATVTAEVNDWKKFNDSLNLINKTLSDKHPHQFTDRPRNFEKDSGVFRIAVLGDSFIWGDGLPYDSVWSHKLEQRILAKYSNVEVMHWGRNGWQTKDEFDFYISDGRKYQPDLLIIGFVDNDADMDRFDHMGWDFRNDYWLFYKVWPSLAEKVLTQAYTNSYAKWQARLYEQENLDIYKGLWLQFMDSLNKDGLDYFLVQTPACLNPNCDTYYKAVQPLLDTLGMEYIDLIPKCKEQLSQYHSDELRANLANFHPGTLMTNLFADEVLLYLESTGRLKPAVNSSIPEVGHK